MVDVVADSFALTVTVIKLVSIPTFGKIKRSFGVLRLYVKVFVKRVP